MGFLRRTWFAWQPACIRGRRIGHPSFSWGYIGKPLYTHAAFMQQFVNIILSRRNIRFANNTLLQRHASNSCCFKTLLAARHIIDIALLLCRLRDYGISVNLHHKQHPASAHHLQYSLAPAHLMQRMAHTHMEQMLTCIRRLKWMQLANSSYVAWSCRSCCMPARSRGPRIASASMVCLTICTCITALNPKI